MYKLAIVDDHAMLRKALASVLESESWQVLFQAANGEDFINMMRQATAIPDVVLLDILMPVKNGFETCSWLHESFPQVKIIALTMNDDELSVLQMLQSGASGYISKNADISELKRAVKCVMKNELYYEESHISKKMVQAVLNDTDTIIAKTLTKRELEFLKYNCSDLSYKEIAAKMHLSPRTVENYRDALFQKFDVKSRLGLALLSIKKGWVKL